MKSFLTAAGLCLALSVAAAEPPANEWAKVSDDDLGPGFSPGLVWSPELKRFVFFCGKFGAQHKGERPYDVMSFDPADGKWRNELPKSAEGRGGETGFVKKVPFKTPWYSLITYDSKRDRLLFTTTPGKGGEPVGQV